MINSDKARRVADYFKKVADKNPKGEIKMMEGLIDYSCGSPMCHGGWYAIKNPDSEDYSCGAQLMAEDLGFACHTSLENWAHAHPDLWGNDRGDAMFICETAFQHPEKRPNGAITLQHIADHWHEVADRLEK